MIQEARENNGDLAVIWLDLANAYGYIPNKVQLTLLDSEVDRNNKQGPKDGWQLE